MPVSALTHLVSIKAVGVSVLCRDPWKKHLSTYHVKKLCWIISYQHRLWKIENVEKKCFINSSKFGLACFFGCSGNLKYLCKEKSGKCLFYLTLCIMHECQFIFLMWCIFLQQIAWEKWVLCYWYEYLSWWWTSVWSAEHLDPVIFDWIKVPCCIWMRLDGLCSLVRDSGSSSLYAHQLLFLVGEFVYDHIIFTQYTDALFGVR